MTDLAEKGGGMNAIRRLAGTIGPMVFLACAVAGGTDATRVTARVTYIDGATQDVAQPAFQYRWVKAVDKGYMNPEMQRKKAALLAFTTRVRGASVPEVIPIADLLNLAFTHDLKPRSGGRPNCAETIAVKVRSGREVLLKGLQPSPAFLLGLSDMATPVEDPPRFDSLYLVGMTLVGKATAPFSLELVDSGNSCPGSPSEIDPANIATEVSFVSQ